MSNLVRIELSIPPTIRDAVASLGDVCTQAVVAGGCLRDTHFGVPYSDIDIFVSPDFDGPALAQKMGEAWMVGELWGSQSKTSAEEYSECFGIHMPAIWGMQEGDDPHPVQIMVWPTAFTVEDLLAQFDFGFSQIAHVDGETFATADFVKDAVENTATFMLPADYRRLDRCWERARRIGQRHPGRRWIWPAGSEPLTFSDPMDSLA